MAMFFGEQDMMIHDDPWFALYFTFGLFILWLADLVLHPSEHIPLLTVLSMIGYIAFECFRAFLRQRSRLADDDYEMPPGDDPSS